MLLQRPTRWAILLCAVVSYPAFAAGPDGAGAILPDLSGYATKHG